VEAEEDDDDDADAAAAASSDGKASLPPVTEGNATSPLPTGTGIPPKARRRRRFLTQVERAPGLPCSRTSI